MKPWEFRDICSDVSVGATSPGHWNEMGLIAVPLGGGGP